LKPAIKISGIDKDEGSIRQLNRFFTFSHELAGVIK